MPPRQLIVLCGLGVAITTRAAETPRWLKPDQPRPGDEERVFTPRGFSRPGVPAVADAATGARLRVVIRDAATGRPTFCRVNVVGPGGDFHQPATNHLKAFGLTGTWPRQMAGNRVGKAPIRYFGRFFYSDGDFNVNVPQGRVAIEAWKGFEFAPIRHEVETQPGDNPPIALTLRRSVDMAAIGWHGGDPHLHFPRNTPEDDQIILDLMEAEDVRYGGILCYNPTSSYRGDMASQEIPQRSLGMVSVARRGDHQILSGQEYRSNQYGHTKVFLVDDLVRAGESYDPNLLPVFADAVKPLRDRGAIVFWAHGGYGKEIFADYLLHAVDGVELLQFGVYRRIGLEGWYRILNIGHRLPASGASDYPACRKLADCRTYVHCGPGSGMDDWLRGMKAGRSFVTTGPLLLLDVEGRRPGDTISLSRPGRLQTIVKLRCEVAPVTHVDLIVNGTIRERRKLDANAGRGQWIELRTDLEIEQPAWIAAAAWSSAPSGSPDAEAHTNPVYVDLAGRRPWNDADAGWLQTQLDQQIAAHRRRLQDPTRDAVLDHFLRARHRLVELRSQQGL